MQLNYQIVKKKLKKLGCVESSRITRGSHRKWRNPKTNKTGIFHDKGGRDISEYTLRDGLKQIGIDWNTFKNI
ncbi:MAG: type II toxin-antitoxin system HicA family toxin [Candidatus Poribacteria bacterium]|nr:type II toxin-antitoxin system HicA family toxin [Candidatus Poribacteria bacterium]